MEEVYEEPRRPSLMDKAARQCRKHPLIPAGMIATVVALTMAFKRMQQRDGPGYQRWLRARVVAQGLTIAAIVVAGVQEMGMGVLTGNGVPVVPPPMNAYESQQFEKRMKEAEEAHQYETGAFSKSSKTSADPSSEPSSIVNAANAATPPPQSSSSSWTSWLGLGRK